MDLELSADDALLFDSVREYVRAEVAPVAGQWDGAGEIPRKAWEAAATLGLTGIRAPEDLGGAGMDAMALAVAIEAVAAASGSLAWVLAVHNALALGHALQVGDATLAASLGFMLPVASPMQTIVFATGRIPVRRMVRAGLWIDAAGAVVLVALYLLLGRLVFA